MRHEKSKTHIVSRVGRGGTRLGLAQSGGRNSCTGLVCWNGAQHNRNSVVSGGIRRLMEAEVLSHSRIAGCRGRHIHDPGTGGSGEHELCSHCVPRSHPRSHLWAGNTRNGRGKGHKDSEGRNGSGSRITALKA